MIKMLRRDKKIKKQLSIGKMVTLGFFAVLFIIGFEITKSQDTIGTASDGLENYFPQMCTESMIKTAEDWGHKMLGCYAFTGSDNNHRWLIWLGLNTGNCTSLMINSGSQEMPVEITCDFAWKVYETLKRMEVAGDKPELHNYSD